jgi:MSHA pilin protein MshA
LQDDAKLATLQAVKASMQTASTIVHSKSLIKGNSTVAFDKDTPPTVSVNDAEMNLDFGYPTSIKTSWDALLDVTDDFVVIQDTKKSTEGNGAVTYVYPIGGSVPNGNRPYDFADTTKTTRSDTCSVRYTESVNGVKPTIEVIPGC